MAGLTQPERYHLVASLPPLGGWRRMLALDRRGAASGPVVLSFAPAALLDDPARLAALARDAEAGARIHHPHVVPVIGLETVDEQLALVQPYRAGTTLRALIDSSGRLPVELAVRVACDAAAGLGALHAVDPGDGEPLAHGTLTAERILVAEDGTSLVEGVGTGAGRSPPEDVRALAEVLHEAIAGEPPPVPPRPLELPGVPPALAAVVDRALGSAPGGPFPSAAALAEALSAAFAPATKDAVAVYAEAAAPPPASPPPFPEPPPFADAPEVSAELINPSAAGTMLESTPTATPAASERTPVPDAAITFPAPRAAGARRRMPLAAVLVALGLVGFGVGFAASRWRGGPGPAPAPAPSPAPAEPAEPLAAPAPSPAAVAPAPVAPPAEAPAVPPRARPSSPSVSVTAVPAVEVLVDGKAVGRAPVQVDVTAGEHEVRLRDRGQRIDVRRKVNVKAPATPVRFNLVRGSLAVTAPPDVEIWVDGRLAGKGDRKIDLWEGSHVVEARRAGSRTVHESFELTPEQSSYTYTVTPTP
jgi:hypothetical protein